MYFGTHRNICVFWVIKKDTKENLVFLGFIILLFTIIYSVSILDYKIGGNIDISKIEKTKNEIYAAKGDIEEIAKNIIKITYILADGTGRFGGMPKEHLEEINVIKDSLFKKLSMSQKEIDSIKADAQRDIEKINEKINNRIK